MKSTIYLLILTLLLGACVEGKKKQSVEVNTPEEVKKEQEQTADIVDTSWKDGMTGKVFHNYLQVRTALVHSDVSGAQKAAANMTESFSDERAELKKVANQIAESDDLENQRALFHQFTQEIELLFKEGLSEGSIYKLYCPMAFDNKGASWFSEVKEVKNPYFGDKMLTCGSVKETIAGKVQ